MEPGVATEKNHNGVPVLAASVVLVASAFAWQLIGAGMIVHVLVLVIGMLMGVFVQQQQQQQQQQGVSSPAPAPTVGAGAGAVRAAAVAGAREARLPAAQGTGAKNNERGLAASVAGQEQIPSVLSNVGGGSSAGATASPLGWVGETMEGSINWLRGNANGSGGRSSVAVENRRGPGVVGNRRRSRSTGAGSMPSVAGAHITREGGAGAEAVALPTQSLQGHAGMRRVVSQALPALVADTPQEQQVQPRSRVWSRTFGGGGQPARTAAAAVGEGLGLDAYDGDESDDDDDADDEDEAGTGSGGEESLRLRGAAGTGDWLVGAGPGDTSESGSLSSVANGGDWRGHIGAAGYRGRSTATGESVSEDTAREESGELRWEVDGRRQNLRRSITSSGVLTEDSEMVQDLLEMVSDTPVDHAGQWKPVRVRRGIHIWTSTVEGSPYCRIRGRMRCEATPAQLLQLLIDDERIVEYDRMFNEYEMVERPNDHTSVRWTSYRAIWPTRPRDFVIRSTWEEFADGTIVIATRSVEHEDYPETPTFVRGKMVMCGYVICPLGESRRQRRGSKSKSAAAPQPTAIGNGSGDAAGTNAAAAAAATASTAAAGAGGSRSMELRPSSEFTMYAHTDLGGVLPASVINKLCKKPAYRVLRKIQDMIATDTLVKRSGEDGSSAGRGGGGAWPLPAKPSNMSRHDSEDVLGSLLVEGMPDRADATNLENVPEGEREGVASSAETETMGHRRGTPSTPRGIGSRRGSMSQSGQLATPSRAPSPLLPGLSRAYAISEAQRIMKTLNRMASDEALGWSQLGVAAHSDMALYKSPVTGTKKVRLGASTCVSALPSELVGILLENAAMLGPDYIVDRQELLETFSSGVNTGEGLKEAAARVEGVEPQHDTAIYWFSCTHKRQRICRDFVILRCFRPLPGCGGLIAYSSVEHPGLPPCPDYVRGKLDVSGFVILPSPTPEYHQEQPVSPLHHSDIEHDRRGGSRNKKRRNVWREDAINNASSVRGDGDGVGGGTLSRRRSRSSASGIGDYSDLGSKGEGDRGVGTTENRKGRGGGEGGRKRAAVGNEGGGVSEVTFFTHLTFSAFLPDFQEMEACRHFVGPLHILQELKWVVERTLGSFQEDELLQEAAAKMRAGGGLGGGADWGRHTSRRRSSKSGRISAKAAEAQGRGGAEVAATVGEVDRLACEGGHEDDNDDGETEGGTADSGSVASVSESESESAPPRGSAAMSNAVLLRVSARREAVLRDMLAFSSDGECMDGPQVDWRIIKDSNGLKLWRATVPGTVWCMIRTRAAVTASPQEVMTYLLDDSCIPEYDELFAKIEVIERVDETSAFKRTSYKPIWPTAPRDFSLLSSWGTLEDGTTYVLNRSVDHPLTPPVKGFVRGVVMLCGFLMVPRAREAGGGCVITMIVHSDLGGNLPAGILNRLSTSSPWRLVQRLRAAFESSDGKTSRAQKAAAEAAANEANSASANGD